MTPEPMTAENRTAQIKTRFAYLQDSFKIICRKCNSEEVDLLAEDCGTCGIHINGECRKCGENFDYHEFKQIELNGGEF